MLTFCLVNMRLGRLVRPLWHVNCSTILPWLPLTRESATIIKAQPSKAPTTPSTWLSRNDCLRKRNERRTVMGRMKASMTWIGTKMNIEPHSPHPHTRSLSNLDRGYDGHRVGLDHEVIGLDVCQRHEEVFPRSVLEHGFDARLMLPHWDETDGREYEHEQSIVEHRLDLDSRFQNKSSLSTDVWFLSKIGDISTLGGFWDNSKLCINLQPKQHSNRIITVMPVVVPTMNLFQI